MDPLEDTTSKRLFGDNDPEADVMPGTPARPTAAEPLSSVISRRAMLKGTGLLAASLVVVPAALARRGDDRGHRGGRTRGGERLTFATVAPNRDPDVTVPEGYDWNVILRWGDPLTPDTPQFDVYRQTADAQARQFGFNADLVLWYPLPCRLKRDVDRDGRLGPVANQLLGVVYPKIKDEYADSALMVVNHEYTKARDMFPDYDPASYPTREQSLVEIEAHGFSIVELEHTRRGTWAFVRDSTFNRRVTGSTPMDISGPLRGHEMMKSRGNPSGTEVYGCLNNCAGGKTPWGTVLTCEENFDQYFANFADVDEDIARYSRRVPAPRGDSRRRWEKHVDRFDLAKDPKEYNRFGYIVEVDPYDPVARPKKRTALGRFKHEGAASRLTRSHRVVIYSGDDARFEYVYKFVSAGRYQRHDRGANRQLLDDGTLYVARFDAGDVAGDDRGTGVWLALSPGNPELADWTLEEILLDTRGAADVVKATPMDRPEDIEVSPQTGGVYIALTNNSKRTEPNEANPRVDNQHGHVIELIEDGDADALTFTWNILIKCGDPTVPGHDTGFGDIEDAVAAGVSPISDPDNLVHDDDGNLWIATDGQSFGGGVGFGQNDGVFAVPVEGEDRGLLRQFLSGVPGGEVCGPEFSGDNEAFFCAIQHPNDGRAFEKQWPTDEKIVSRPSLIGVYERRGRKIGE